MKENSPKKNNTDTNETAATTYCIESIEPASYGKTRKPKTSTNKKMDTPKIVQRLINILSQENINRTPILELFTVVGRGRLGLG